MDNWKQYIPIGFKRSEKAPPDIDIEWLVAFLTIQGASRRFTSIVEFGCGITTILTHSILRPTIYIALETFQPCIDEVRRHISAPGFAIFKNWDSIKAYRWDFVFIDGSSGCGAEKGHHRDLALRAAMLRLHNGAIILFHDSKHAEGKKVERVIKQHNSEHPQNPSLFEWADSSFNGRGWAAYKYNSQFQKTLKG